MNGFTERIADKQYWADQLGLLPIPLRPNDEHEYIMLNGSRGNFCFAGTAAKSAIDDERGIAWSSDVAYFVRVDQEQQKLRVYRWDEPTVEEVAFSDIVDSLEPFRAYLEDTEPLRSDKSVERILRTAEILRSHLNETGTGEQSINALLILLAAAFEDVEPSRLRLEDWKIKPAAHALAAQIGPETWETLRRELRIDSATSPRLYPSFVLRHAAGRLFQEANYSVSLSERKALPGFEMVERRPKRMAKIAWQGFFTPPMIARTLVDRVLKDFAAPTNREIVIFDPACGSGEFLREAVRQLALVNWTYKPRLRLIGYDVSPIAEAMTRFALTAEKRTTTEFSIEFEVKRCDALDAVWPENVDLLFMNPPFIAFPDTTPEQRSTMERWLTLQEMGRRPDFSHAFIARATQALAPQGRLGTVLPLSVLDAESGAALRDNRLRSLVPTFIASIGNLAFLRATVDAALYVGRSGADGVDVAEAVPTYVWTDHRRESMTAALRRVRIWPGNDLLSDGYSIYTRRLGTEDENWVPRPLQSIELYERYAELPRISNIFNVEQGVRTGNVSVFQIDDEEYRSLPVSERKFFRPAIVNASIENGQIADLAYVFYPYGTRDVETENDLRQKLPVYYGSKLLPSRKSLKVRNRTNPDRWWLLAEPRAEAVLAGKPKIITTYFGQPGSASFDATGRFVVVQGFGWTPRHSKHVLDKRTAHAYVGLMNTQVFFSVVAARSKRVAGGQYNLSRHFIKNLPLPNLFPPPVLGEGGETTALASAVPGDVFDGLANVGAAMVSGERYDAVSAEQYAHAAYEAFVTLAPLRSRL